MINNLSQNAIIDNATPISRNLLGLLGGPAKGFSSPRNSLLDFQNLVKLRLGSRSGDRNTIAGFAPPPADPLPFMAGAFLGKLKKVAPGTSPVALDSLSRKIVEPGHQPIGRVELASLKEITSIFKGFATKVGHPIAFKVRSKTLGPISVQIDPTKNRLNVTLTAEMPQAKNRQNVKETVLAELSAIFGSAPVVTFDQTAAGVVPPATRKAQPVPISQPDALEIIGTFMDLGDAGLLSADGLQIHLDLDVEGVGNVAVDLASEANKTFAQLRTNSTKTLSALKGMFLKSDVLDRLEVQESGHGVKISKANTLNAHPAPKAQVIANPNVGEEVTAPVSTKVGFEVIGNAIDAVLQPSKTAGAANKEIVHLQFESLGDVQVEIEPHQGKADLKVQVESPLAREVFEDRLQVWQSKISDVKISVRNKVGSLSRQTETNVAAVIGAKDDLTTPKVL
ncbi:MAG: hypothetical protein ACE5G1_02630, partial [bacterium]